MDCAYIAIIIIKSEKQCNIVQKSLHLHHKITATAGYEKEVFFVFPVLIDFTVNRVYSNGIHIFREGGPFMSQQEFSEHKPKKRSKAGIIFLIILLLLAGTVGYLYYSVFKAPLALDDPQKLASSAPMSAEERFYFSSQDQTVRVKLDKTDIWNQILAHAGNDFLDTINEEVSAFDLSVSGCAIHMDQKGLQLNLELYYRETRLVAGIPCDLEVNGRQIALKPAGLKLGVIRIPVGGLMSSLKLEYDVMLPVLAEVTQVGYDEGAILLTGNLEQDVRALVPTGEVLDRAVLFCEAFQPLADSLESQTGFSDIMAYLEQNPGSVEDLYRELFTLAEPAVTEAYLKDRNGLTQRFFPGIDFDAVAQQQKVLDKELRVHYITLKKFFTNAVNEYNANRLRICDGVFIFEEEPFQAALFEYRKYGTVFEVLDPEPVFLVVVDAEDGFVRKTPALNQLVAETEQFTQKVDLNKIYILGCVLRSVDGEPYLLYETELTDNGLYIREAKLHALTEDAVTALQVSGQVGVWAD